MPAMAEYMPVQGNQIVVAEIGEERLEVRILIQNDELVAIDEGDPVVFGGVMIEAMLVCLDLLGAAGIARIVVVDQPGTDGDVVAVQAQNVVQRLARIVVVEVKVVDAQKPMMGDPLLDKGIFVLEDGPQAHSLSPALGLPRPHCRIAPVVHQS